MSDLCFFVSSRRRHTRWPRDWSSDVCSSDLAEQIGAARVFIEHMAPASYAAAVEYGLDPTVVIAQSAHETGWGRFGGVLDATRSEERRVGRSGEDGERRRAD